MPDLSDIGGLIGPDGGGFNTAGWLDLPERHMMAQTLPTFEDDWKLFAEPSTPILLHRAFHDVLGGPPSYPAQQIGDCVSFGHAHGNDLLQCVEIARGERSEYRETSTEYIYGASRKAAGILGRSDGSYGAAAVAAMTQGGMVQRTAPYSGQKAKSYGYYGPPAELAQEAANFKLGGCALVADWQGLVSATWNGLPVSICSNQGFTLQRDSQGFCRPKGSWAHCMLIVAVRFDRPGALILQSWGMDTPTGPTALDQPPYSFWADKDVVVRILAARDSWALMGAPEFAQKAIPPSWTVA